MLKKRRAKSNQRILAGNPVWRAFAQKPMPQRLHTSVALANLSAFDELMSGSGNRAHASRLYASSNMGLILSGMGYGPEFMDDIRAAQAAVLACQERALNGRGYTLEPAEADALRVFLEIHQQQTELATEAEIGKAFAEVEDWMAS